MTFNPDYLRKFYRIKIGTLELFFETKKLAEEYLALELVTYGSIVIEELNMLKDMVVRV